MNTESATKMKNTDYLIETTLRLLGLNNSYKGFHYLIYAIRLVLEDPSVLTYICKGLYVEIAIHFDTTIASAERNIRTAKELIWNNANKDTLESVFGSQYPLKAPHNALFIDMLSHYIKSIQ